MIRYENDCTNCATETYPCIGDMCPNKNAPHYYCDKCGYEEDLYYYDGDQLCLKCIKADLTKVEV